MASKKKITKQKVKQIDELLQCNKLSDRAIANQLGVDCGYVVSRRRALQSSRNFKVNMSSFSKKLEEAEKKAGDVINQEEIDKVVSNIDSSNPELFIPVTGSVVASTAKRYSLEDKMAMAEAYQELQSLKEVSDKFGCSVGVVRSACKDFGVSMAPKGYTKAFRSKPEQQEKKEETVVEDFTPGDGDVEAELKNHTVFKDVLMALEDKEEYKPFSTNGKHVVCSMFSARHQVPDDCKLSIFESRGLDPDQIFDFDMMDNTIEKFIDKNINFDSNGKPDADLVVYISGLQTAFGSLFKICAKKNIKLTLMHGNIEGKYIPQPITSDYTYTPINSMVAKFVGDFDQVMLYKDFDQDNMSKQFYAITKTYYKTANTSNPKVKLCYCCDSQTDAFKIFSDQSMDILATPDDYAAVYMYLVKSDGKRLSYGRNITKCYNFKDM